MNNNNQIISKNTQYCNGCSNKTLGRYANYGDEPTWSNVDGYGNIMMFNVKDCGGIKTIVKPWNRIPALESPYSSSVNPVYAWSPSPLAPVSKKKMHMLNMACNICNNYPRNSPCPNC